MDIDSWGKKQEIIEGKKKGGENVLNNKDINYRDKNNRRDSNWEPDR